MDELELLPIASSSVEKDGGRYTQVMLKHFGVSFPWIVEANVYAWMNRLSPDYRGAQWKLHELSNGGFWMHPEIPCLRIEWHGNGFEDTVSGEVAGLVACLFCFGHLAEVSHSNQAERFAEYYHRLRDYALMRADHLTILQAID